MMMRTSLKSRSAPAVANTRRGVAARATKYDEELIKTAVRCLQLTVRSRSGRAGRARAH